MDAPSSGFPNNNIRVSDADRDQAVSELSEHFQTGRITQDEFEDRSDRALRARTGIDLNELFTDLPPRPLATAAPAADFAPDLAAGGDVRPGTQHHYHVPVFRMVIAFIIVSTVMGHIFGPGNGGALGWLIPVVVLGLIFLRRNTHHRRR